MMRAWKRDAAPQHGDPIPKLVKSKQDASTIFDKYPTCIYGYNRNHMIRWSINSLHCTLISDNVFEQACIEIIMWAPYDWDYFCLLVPGKPASIPKVGAKDQNIKK
eukprot:1068861-Amphidinium_carterae.1